MSALMIPSAGPTPTTPSIHLTRRGRLVFLGLPALLAAAALLFSLLAVLLGAAASPAHASTLPDSVDMSHYARMVTVLPGESLWSIAAAGDPHRDVRDVVAEIVALNDLGTGVLQPGQRLYVPVRH